MSNRIERITQRRLRAYIRFSELGKGSSKWLFLVGWDRAYHNMYMDRLL